MAAARLAYAPGQEDTPQTDGLRLLLVEYIDPGTGRGYSAGHWWLRFPPGTPANGWFLVRGQLRGQQFVVEEVLRRAPITAPDGAVLQTSWPAGASAPVRRWERP